MHYFSSRNNNKRYQLSKAIQLGLAPDGGLFIPESWPTFNNDELSKETSYPVFCSKVLKPFFDGDPLATQLEGFCQQAFNFDLQLKKLNDNTYILELFHGPTLSFKDFGARFLAQCLNALAQHEKITIMVATSGDTGSAVAAAFHKQANIEVIILFPQGKVSKRQQQQITCWGDNIKAYAVQGNFDDCQRLVKAAFNDPDCQTKFNLCTANSINIARLLPQACYYAFISLHLQKVLDKVPSF